MKPLFDSSLYQFDHVLHPYEFFKSCAEPDFSALIMGPGIADFL